MSQQLRTPGRKKYVTNTEDEELVSKDPTLYLIGKGNPIQLWSFTSMNKGAVVEVIPIYSTEETGARMVERLAEKHYRLVPFSWRDLEQRVMKNDLLFILNLEAVVRGEQAYLKEGSNWMLTKEELEQQLLATGKGKV